MGAELADDRHVRTTHLKFIEDSQERLIILGTKGYLFEC